MHLPPLIQDLGVILIVAAIVTLLCKRFKQPVVLGYLIAGFMVGPHFTFLPSVKDTANITIWAEIGVIFLLFSLGLEFSFKKLTSVGKSASITATFEILFMLGSGYLAGQILGWSKMDSLFMGGILSISSTTIIVRAFDELGLKGRNFVQLVFGVLVVEDLIAILLLVLLSSVAVTQTLSGIELARSSLRLGFFLVLWFLLGIYLLPTLLRKTRDYLSNETILIVSIALCLMMVITASVAGFSPALGAFVMGSILAETREGHRIEHLIVPVRDLFSAVFFVSVGMLINPAILVKYFWVILLMTAVTILGKLVSSTLGALVSGRSLKDSVQAGMSLAQIGEFSFIIATLGLTLKVTSDFLYPIAVAVSAITTFSTPYLIRYTPNFYLWLERQLPPRIIHALTRYEIAMNTTSTKTFWSLFWKECGMNLILNSVVVIAITLVMSQFALPKLSDFLDHSTFLKFFVCGITLALSSPFLWAIFIGRPLENLKRFAIGIFIFRITIGAIVVGFVISNFTSLRAVSGILLLGLAGLGVFFSRHAEPLYRRIEGKFILNLADNEKHGDEEPTQVPELAPWNATLAEFKVSPHSPLIAKTLQESGIKEHFGVTVAMIERGGRRILAPQRDDLLLPHDHVFLIGTEDQLVAAREALETKHTGPLPPVMETLGLTSLQLLSTDTFIHRPIRECGLREAVNGLIVGIEREGKRILSPDSSLSLLPGDLIWIVGDRSLIKKLREK